MTHARTLFLLVTLIALLDAPVRGQTRAPAAPPFVVIVHRSNPTRSVSRTFLADAFLKRTTRWPNGETLRPVDQRQSSAVRAQFSERVLQRPVPAVRSYWQQIIFSGRGVPPVELDSDRDVVRYVGTHLGAVGYVAGTTDTSAVSVLGVQ